MRIDPVIPEAWPGFSVRYCHGEAIYAIEVQNPSGCQRGILWVEIDGKREAGKVIPLERKLVKHRVVVMMGNSAKPVDKAISLP
jgi:cyclic beta-1,2-glucan synthetase